MTLREDIRFAESALEGLTAEMAVLDRDARAALDGVDRPTARALMAERRQLAASRKDAVYLLSELREASRNLVFAPPDART